MPSTPDLVGDDQALAGELPFLQRQQRDVEVRGQLVGELGGDGLEAEADDLEDVGEVEGDVVAVRARTAAGSSAARPRGRPAERLGVERCVDDRLEQRPGGDQVGRAALDQLHHDLLADELADRVVLERLGGVVGERVLVDDLGAGVEGDGPEDQEHEPPEHGERDARSCCGRAACRLTATGGDRAVTRSAASQSLSRCHRWGLVVAGGLLVFLLVASQILVPSLGERGIEERLDRAGGGSAEVTLGAFPAAAPAVRRRRAVRGLARGTSSWPLDRREQRLRAPRRLRDRRRRDRRLERGAVRAQRAERSAATARALPARHPAARRRARWSTPASRDLDLPGGGLLAGLTRGVLGIRPTSRCRSSLDIELPAMTGRFGSSRAARTSPGPTGAARRADHDGDSGLDLSRLTA